MKKVFYILSVLLLAFTACGTDGKDNNSDDPWEWNNPDEGKPDEGKPDNDGTVFYPKAEGSVRIMSYNVGAFSKYLSNSTEMVAAMILEAEADVVGLNELDSCNTRHNVNQVKALAAALDGWKWTFGRAMSYKDGAYGNGVVVPRNTDIIDSYTVALPKGTGSEPRSIAVVETPDYILGAAHLDHTSEESVLGQIEVVHASSGRRLHRHLYEGTVSGFHGREVYDAALYGKTITQEGVVQLEAIQIEECISVADAQLIILRPGEIHILVHLLHL